MTTPWLSLIGIGEDGAEGLTNAARALIHEATLIVGGARHLAMVDARAETLPWPSPLTDALPAIIRRRGTPIVVLASGDPFFYGVGDLLSQHIAPQEIFCIPSPSAFSLAASRLKWSQQECALLSLHGRAFERVTPHLHPRAKIIALSWDGSTPARLAGHLASRGMGGSRIIVLERLGGPHERVREARARDFTLGDVQALNTVAVEIECDDHARVIPLAPGLRDDWFEHDGQLTKREIRAVTLAALEPRKGELLWDVGAGAGSIAIEWMLSHPSNRAIAIERDESRAARVARNAVTLGVPDLEIVTGAAPTALAALAAPDAIFIGGGATDATLETCWRALPRNGRIVVNAVTLETQSSLAQAYRDKGGELIHMQFSHARGIGRFHALDPAMAVTQWRAVKR
ncbi:MAG: precorrin-6y C5,15-methyltransferase (decarboxylating) subunit CbiE [Methylocystis sp.]|nr:precorrin-6y C5,15-methyltransferase (decarboxylating) subunit CbiE [Methylocystis sp.]